MGWYDRIGKIAGGFVDLGAEVVELGFDTAKAFVVEDEYDGVAATVNGILKENLIKGVLGTAFGPEGGIGSIIEAIPEEARAPVRQFVVPVLGQIDALQDEYIERPLATAALVYGMSGGLGNILNPVKGIQAIADTDSWQTAWRIASTGIAGEYERRGIDFDLSKIPEADQEIFTKALSLGRAGAFALEGTDLLNPQSAVEASQSAYFNLVSGSIDFAETIFLDPLLIVGKPYQLARAGKLATSGSRGLDVAQSLRRSKRSDLTPSYTLMPQRGEKLPISFKLTPDQRSTFTSRRADQVVKSKNWGKINNLIYAGTKFDDLGISDQALNRRLDNVNDSLERGTVEYEELISQRAGEIRREIGENKIDQDTALGLARATNETMRSNHYRYMMGDHKAAGEAAKAAEDFGERVNDIGSKLDELDELTGEMDRYRSELAGRSASRERKLEQGKEFNEDTFDKNLQQIGRNLGAAAERRNTLVREISDALPGGDEWDFGFVFDLKTKYDSVQIEDLSSKSPISTYGDDVGKFFRENIREDADLVSAAVNRWMLDGLGSLDELPRKAAEGVPETITRLLRERKTVDRQIYAPLSVRANNSISGTAAKVYESAAKGIKGRRRVQNFAEKTTQRFFIVDDMVQAGNQFDRMVRDFQRVGGGLLSDAEAGRLLSQWQRLGGLEAANQRQAMLLGTIDEFNKRFAQRAVDEGVIDVADMKKFAGELSKRYHAANSMLVRAKPSGKFGASDRSRVAIRDGDTITQIDVPLSPRQLAGSLLMPRYDLLDEAFSYVSKGGIKGRLRNSGFAEDIRKVRKGAIRPVDGVMAAWRPAVLLRPAWPMRVVGDEALRVMSVVGAIPQLRAMISGSSDFRVELLRRRGIDPESAVLTKMRKRLDDEDPGIVLPDEASSASANDTYLAYRTKYGDDAIQSLYEAEVKEQWGRYNRAKGIAIRSGLGFALLGPGGAIGAAAIGYASASKTARRLASRQLGETYGSTLRLEANRLLKEADASGVENAESLRAAANLLLAREKSLKRVMKDYGIDKADPNYETLEVADAAGARLQEAGRSPFLINGVLVRNAVGEDNVAAEAITRRVSADRSSQALLKGASDRAQEALEPEFFDYISLTSKNVEEFNRAWDKTVNRQWRVTGNELSHERKYLEQVWSPATSKDEYITNLSRFLRTPDGKKILEQLRVPKSEDAFAGFVQAVFETTNQILPQFRANGQRIGNFDSYRNSLRNGTEISWREIDATRKEMPPALVREIDADLEMNQTVGNVAGVTTKAEGTKRIGEMVNEAYKVLGTLPTDHLARLPFFRASYEREMAKRLSSYIDPETGEYVFKGDTMQSVIDRVEASARESALKDVRFLLYDLTENTRTQESLSNLMPFLGAWQEVFSRWGHITKENPAYVARVLDNFNSIPIQEDDEGNRFMVVRAPEFLKDMPGGSGLLKAFAGQELRFSQDAMSMISAGGPGFGPIATIPMTQIAIEEPSLREAFDYLWPYGLPQGESFTERSLGQLMPAWTKRAASYLAGGDEMERMSLSIARDRIVTLRQTPATEPEYDSLYAQYLATPEGRVELHRDIRESSKALMLARTFASMAMPTSMMVQSPYNYYIEELRKYQEEDPKTATDRFLAEFGEEYFGIVQRTTKSGNGVMPVIESWENFQKFQPLVEAYPEVGGLITAAVGSDKAQKFNEAVYRRQQSDTIGPGSDVKQRERISLEDFIDGPDVKEGWEAYRAMMDIRDNELRRRGEMGMSTSLQAKTNVDVKAYYQASMLDLQQKHSSWWTEFNVQDRLATSRKMAGLRKVVADQVLMEREDIQILSMYLDDREIVQNELRARKDAGGSANLDAQSNADVNLYWEAIRLKYSDIEEFKDVYNRFLNNDTVLENTWGEA
tara:strand:- start:1266 stop:6917 length:5652 start_codon:yes stop_codon:yes gene_type:complete